MELGIFSKVYPCAELTQTVGAIGQDGFSCAHVNLESIGLPKDFLDIAPSLAAEVKRGFSGSGVKPLVLSATYNLIHPDPKKREADISRMRRLIGLAAEAGIPYLAICTGSRDPENMWRGHPDNASPQAWNDLFKSMEALLPFGESAGVKLAVEVEPSNVISTPQAARLLLQTLKSKALTLIMDGCNLTVGHKPADAPLLLSRAFEWLGDEVSLAHAKDYDAQSGKMLPAGRGSFDYRLYLSLLERLSRPVPLLLHGLERGDAATSRAFILQQWEACAGE